MTATTTDTGYEELAAAIRGDLTRPGDPGYDQARAVYNAMIDKHPQAIVRVRPLPGQLQEVASADAVNGVPVAKRRIPFSCHPPSICPATRFWFSKDLPLPNGSS